MGWGSKLFVIGGDGELVRELLDKRGAIYSQRPYMYRHLLLDKFESPLCENFFHQNKVSSSTYSLISIAGSQTGRNGERTVDYWCNTSDLRHESIRPLS